MSPRAHNRAKGATAPTRAARLTLASLLTLGGVVTLLGAETLAEAAPTYRAEAPVLFLAAFLATLAVAAFVVSAAMFFQEAAQ